MRRKKKEEERRRRKLIRKTERGERRRWEGKENEGR